ncbi:MAG: hypothetical protein AB7F89_03725 [Pirellulaceae bacterium]
MSSTFVIRSLVPALFVVTALGCGSGRAKIPVVKVAGTVKMAGKPLDGAEINFMTEQYAGVAKTDASGHYELEAQAGSNKVYVIKFQGAGPEFDQTMVPSGADTPGAQGPKQIVPKQFSDPAGTTLEFNVPEGGTTEANFDLTAK